MSFNTRPERKITDFRQLDDQRTLQDGYTDNRKDMYNAMLNLILKHKVELQKIPATSAYESAVNWAKKRGLRAGQEDLDRDGRPETIVYNKAGKPWIINGYKLKASDYPIRHAFYSQFPTPESRAGESMREWITDQAYNVREDPNNPWKKHVSNTAFGDQLKEWGYRMPTKPKKKQSVFNIFCKLIAPVLKEYYEGGDLPKTFFGDEAGPPCVTLFKKIVSPISMYRILYLKMVERPYFFFTMQTREEYANMTYKQFKQYIKNYENVFYSWFKQNYLDQTQTQFKPGRVTPIVIQGQLVKDGIDWDGGDPDDAVVFMLGLENMTSDEAGDILRNGDLAAEFLKTLKDKKDRDYKANTKALTKWKKIAAASQKKFFKDQIQYLFENNGAFNAFKWAMEHGLNPLAATTQQAVEEAAENPVSPMRQPTRQQVVQDNQHRGEPAPMPPEIPDTPELRRRMEELNREEYPALPEEEEEEEEK